MSRLFLIVTFVLLCAHGFADDNDNNRILSLDEINADLQAKKKELEPFDPSAVKVDLESLGLDDVSKKNEEKIDASAKIEAVIPNDEIPTKIISAKELDAKKEKSIEEKFVFPPLPELKTEAENKEELGALPQIAIPETKPKKAAPVKKISDVVPLLKLEKTEVEKDNFPKIKGKSKPEKKADSGVMSRIKNILHSQDKTEEKKQEIKDDKKTAKADPKKPLVAPKEKKILEKEHQNKENKKWQEEKEKKRSLKLENLRKKYISEVDVNKDQYSWDYLFSSESVIPKRKDLGMFAIEDAPASPILNNYRTRENLHIPLITSRRKRLAILFNNIASGDISAFNGSYKYINNPNVKNSSGDTLLTYAILLQRYPLIASIISKGADVNQPNILGYTPVDIALELNDFETLEILVNNKANLKYVDAFGRNYLMHAARTGVLSAINLFINQGIDINAMDNNGLTALAIAHQHNQNVVATYLLKHGAKAWIKRAPYEPQRRSLIKELENNWK